jgi:hypothetical protein
VEHPEPSSADRYRCRCRQPRLADTGLPDDEHGCGTACGDRLQRRHEAIELLSSTEARGIGRLLERRRKRGPKTRVVQELEHLDGFLEASQQALAHRAEPCTGPTPAQVHRRGGHEDRAPRRLGAQPAGLDRRGAHPVVGLLDEVAAADADAQGVGGADNGEATSGRLQGRGRVEGCNGAGERRHHPVADALHHRPTSGRDDLPAGPLELSGPFVGQRVADSHAPRRRADEIGE